MSVVSSDATSGSGSGELAGGVKTGLTVRLGQGGAGVAVARVLPTIGRGVLRTDQILRTTTLYKIFSLLNAKYFPTYWFGREIRCLICGHSVRSRVEISLAILLCLPAVVIHVCQARLLVQGRRINTETKIKCNNCSTHLV